jgi:membrane-associated phospholipid phosphatase
VNDSSGQITVENPPGLANSTFAMSLQASRWTLPICLVLAALAALAVDVPIARAFRLLNGSEPVHPWLSYFDVFEQFGHGLTGLIIVGALLHQLDPSRRWAIPRLVACTAAAGVLADVLKMLVVRVRPYDFTLQGSVWSTFGPWLPGWNAGSGGQSFPSGHTATAVAMAATLMWLYPQGWRLFLALAILVGCQRVVSGVHYPSDVLFGAAIGCTTAFCFLHVSFLPRCFQRWEARWLKDPPP